MLLRSQCCCMENLVPSLTSVNASLCNQSCMGNTLQMCGGQSGILYNVYNSKSGDVNFGKQIKCSFFLYTLSGVNYALGQNTSTMSIGSCVQLCKAASKEQAFLKTS